MATFISRITLTDQGMKDIRSTCKRAEEFKGAAGGMGIEIRGLYWTMGASDGLVIFDAPDEETATAAMLYLGSFGKVHTETVRAYEAADMEPVIGKMPN